MGLGSTAKKLQQMADMSKELYGRVNELREQLVGVRDTVDDTSERVGVIESELAEQRAVLDALAAEQGVDVAEVVAAVDDGAEGDGEATPEATDVEESDSADDEADAPTASAADGGA